MIMYTIIKFLNNSKKIIRRRQRKAGRYQRGKVKKTKKLKRRNRGKRKNEWGKRAARKRKGLLEGKQER